MIDRFIFYIAVTEASVLPSSRRPSESGHYSRTIHLVQPLATYAAPNLRASYRSRMRLGLGDRLFGSIYGGPSSQTFDCRGEIICQLTATLPCFYARMILTNFSEKFAERWQS
jgi:hypothetical protein